MFYYKRLSYALQVTLILGGEIRIGRTQDFYQQFISSAATGARGEEREKEKEKKSEGFTTRAATEGTPASSLPKSSPSSFRLIS